MHILRKGILGNLFDQPKKWPVSNKVHTPICYVYIIHDLTTVQFLTSYFSAIDWPTYWDYFLEVIKAFTSPHLK